MAQVTIRLNIYEVDGRTVTVAPRVFSTEDIFIRPYDGSNSTVLYSIIKDAATKKEYAVVETTAVLNTSINT